MNRPSYVLTVKEIPMGMFDIVIVESPLPDVGAAEVNEWQTKDFPDPYLENYTITADGRLLRERIHDEDQSDPQYPIGTFERLARSMTRIHDGWDDLHFHGILNFYGDKYSGESRLMSPARETFGKDRVRSMNPIW
jgi:hypothetical protein